MLRIYVDALYLSRRQTAGVAKATLRIVDDERTVQTREDGVLNKSVVPKLKALHSGSAPCNLHSCRSFLVLF